MFAITQRLLLRPGWQEDAPAVHQAIADEAIVRNLARAPWPYSLKDAEDFVQLPIEQHSPRWLIFQRGVAGSAVVGCIGIDRMENGNIELGYWIGRNTGTKDMPPRRGKPFWPTPDRWVTTRLKPAISLTTLLQARYFANWASAQLVKSSNARRQHVAAMLMPLNLGLIYPIKILAVTRTVISCARLRPKNF